MNKICYLLELIYRDSLKIIIFKKYYKNWIGNNMDFNLTNNILKNNNNEIAIFIHEKLRVSVLEKCKNIKSN